MNRLKVLYIMLIAGIFTMPACYAFLEGGSFNTHDMQSIQAQQFRYQQYNDFKEMQEQKLKYQRETEEVQQEKTPVIEKFIKRKTNSQFIEDNGMIRIQNLE